MIVSLFTSILLIVGQVPATSDLGTPYIFKLYNEDTPIYAYAYTSEVEERSFMIRIVEPWNRISKTLELSQKDIEDKTVEVSVAHKSRIAKEWEGKGKFIGSKWMLLSELELARRAQDLAAGEEGGKTVDIEIQPETTNLTTTEPIGFITQWWLHVVIGTGFLAFAGLTFWWGFLRQTWVGLGE
jgi:hypothetical protein